MNQDEGWTNTGIFKLNYSVIKAVNHEIVTRVNTTFYITQVFILLE